MTAARLLYGLDQARDIVRKQSGLLLFLTPPGGVEFGGPAFYLEILDRLREDYPDRDIQLLLDCGRNGGLAIEAIRLGAKDIHFDGHPDAERSIRAVAREESTRLWATLPKPA